MICIIIGYSGDTRPLFEMLLKTLDKEKIEEYFPDYFSNNYSIFDRYNSIC